uniref:Uncharacterized protein n=1 Tax=viral metagenome TaxID=1070528 RepID=A0A6C0LL39_9ZZZZ
MLSKGGDRPTQRWNVGIRATICLVLITMMIILLISYNAQLGWDWSSFGIFSTAKTNTSPSAWYVVGGFMGIVGMICVLIMGAEIMPTLKSVVKNTIDAFPDSIHNTKYAVTGNYT